MFTGLIEAVGKITSVDASAGGIRIRVETPLAGVLSNGDSLAVDGVCLTATSVDDNGMHADISLETGRVTTLGAVKPSTLVNLERPLRADARLGGHFVQGHVDAVGTVSGLEPEGDAFRLAVQFPPAVAPYIVRKGSIAVNGVSLTVAALEHDRFEVQIIPYTWTQTNLRTLASGRLVNLECDILGKYVVRALELAGGDPRSG